MKYNLEHFSEIMEQQISEDVNEIAKQYEEFYTRLSADMARDISSDEIQYIVHEINLCMRKQRSVDLMGNSYLKIIINSYSSDYVKAITDTKYGIGGSDYIVKAFQFYLDNRNVEKKHINFNI